MLASGASVKIGTYEYTIDESVETNFTHHYRHYFNPITSQKSSIAGLGQGQENVDPERILTGYTDWSGGEGINTLDPSQPTLYRIANGMNVRNIGQFTARPKRTVGTLATTDSSKQPYMRSAAGAVWIAQYQRVHYSQDWGSTWTSVTAGNTGVSGYAATAFITAIAGDDQYLYYSAWDPVGTKRIIYRHDVSTNAQTTAVLTASGAVVPYANLEVFNGRLYGWTGRKLFEMDLIQAPNIDPTGQYFRKQFDTGVDPPTSQVQGNQWSAGMVACGPMLCFFYSSGSDGGTVWAYANGVPRPIWQAPLGFRIGSIIHSHGVLFVTGHWGYGLVSSGSDTTSKGSGQLYAIRLNTLEEVDLGPIRAFDGDATGGLLMTRACESWNAQIMLAGPATGRVFIYDLSTDGLSMLDTLLTSPAGGDGLVFTSNPNYRMGDVLTAGKRRYGTAFTPNASGNTTFQYVLWDDDTTANRETDGQMMTDSTTTNYLIEGEYDDGYPIAPKLLQGFHVQFMVEDTNTTSGLLANQRIIVQYSADGGSYVTAGTITSTTTPKGAKGYVYLAVSGVTYNRLRVKYFVDNNNTDGVQPPVVYCVIRDSTLNEYEEVWDLIVRVWDEDDETSPENRRYTGSQIRDYLETLFKNRAEVTFLDGYRYGKHSAPGTYTTHTVKLVSFEDVILKPGEGHCIIELRAKASA